MEQFSQQLEAQSSELHAAQLQPQHDSEQSAVSRMELEGVSQERDALQAGHDTALAAMDQLRREKEKLTGTMAEVAEKLRSQKTQTQSLSRPARICSPSAVPSAARCWMAPAKRYQEHQGNGE